MTDINTLIKEAADRISAALPSEKRTTAQIMEDVKKAVKAALESAAPTSLWPLAPDYDPDTCITAAELRAMGLEVHPNVPDVGWVPRAAMRMSAEAAEHTPEDIAAGLLKMDMSVTFTAPFRWIELNVQAVPPVEQITIPPTTTAP
ncbi:hypothetical protein [Tardiphaga sp. 862_B3_N1_1]|uniref:hypothetical protein n=1 Tax=Tardiphaga sp. 862_B3_N1_1 TaxID=3240763 RepID=UPI003F8AB606